MSDKKYPKQLFTQEDINGLNMWQAGGGAHLFVCYSAFVNIIGILSYIVAIYTLFVARV